FFFFQAKDGIRDRNVTGVQTCALPIFLVSKAQSAIDLTQILFGNVLFVRSSDMWMTLVIGSIVLLVILLFYKEFLVTSFDPTMAAAYGLPTRVIHYALMVLLSLVTVASVVARV